MNQSCFISISISHPNTESIRLISYSISHKIPPPPQPSPPAYIIISSASLVLKLLSFQATTHTHTHTRTHKHTHTHTTHTHSHYVTTFCIKRQSNQQVIKNAVFKPQIFMVQTVYNRVLKKLNTQQIITVYIAAVQSLLM